MKTKVPKNMERGIDAKKFPDSQQVETILENLTCKYTTTPTIRQQNKNTHNNYKQQQIQITKKKTPTTTNLPILRFRCCPDPIVLSGREVKGMTGWLSTSCLSAPKWQGSPNCGRETRGTIDHRRLQIGVLIEVLMGRRKEMMELLSTSCLSAPMWQGSPNCGREMGVQMITDRSTDRRTDRRADGRTGRSTHRSTDEKRTRWWDSF